MKKIVLALMLLVMLFSVAATLLQEELPRLWINQPYKVSYGEGPGYGLLYRISYGNLHIGDLGIAFDDNGNYEMSFYEWWYEGEDLPRGARFSEPQFRNVTYDSYYNEGQICYITIVDRKITHEACFDIVK